MLGDNPMHVPYTVGQHPNSPKNPQSAPASGGTNISDVRNSPAEEAHVWYGAMVGGPLQDDKFWDWRDDWAQVESALDYVSVLPTMAAMQVSNVCGHDSSKLAIDSSSFFGTTTAGLRPRADPHM